MLLLDRFRLRREFTRGSLAVDPFGGVCVRLFGLGYWEIDELATLERRRVAEISGTPFRARWVLARGPRRPGKLQEDPDEREALLSRIKEVGEQARILMEGLEDNDRPGAPRSVDEYEA